MLVEKFSPFQLREKERKQKFLKIKIQQKSESKKQYFSGSYKMVQLKNKKNMASSQQQQSQATSNPEQTVACVSSISGRSQSREMRPLFPEGLNAEELISQINYRSSNESSNNTNRNNNTNSNNNHRDSLRGSIDIEKGSVRRYHKHRPLYRRFFSFIRNMWMGAKFSAKTGE